MANFEEKLKKKSPLHLHWPWGGFHDSSVSCIQASYWHKHSYWKWRRFGSNFQMGLVHTLKFDEDKMLECRWLHTLVILECSQESNIILITHSSKGQSCRIFCLTLFFWANCRQVCRDHSGPTEQETLGGVQEPACRCWMLIWYQSRRWVHGSWLSFCCKKCVCVCVGWSRTDLCISAKIKVKLGQCWYHLIHLFARQPAQSRCSPAEGKSVPKLLLEHQCSMQITFTTRFHATDKINRRASTRGADNCFAPRGYVPASAHQSR